MTGCHSRCLTASPLRFGGRGSCQWSIPPAPSGGWPTRGGRCIPGRCTSTTPALMTPRLAPPTSSSSTALANTLTTSSPPWRTSPFSASPAALRTCRSRTGLPPRGTVSRGSTCGATVDPTCRPGRTRWHCSPPTSTAPSRRSLEPTPDFTSTVTRSALGRHSRWDLITPTRSSPCRARASPRTGPPRSGSRGSFRGRRWSLDSALG
mmetsp:Transcript_11243/g.33693  ORF Transcript_11243/g.33693 Transcript_11243/m.33693 type:complete len:207 (-) Transcript_11243:472-1092(-)